jgi:hypothetical protein
MLYWLKIEREGMRVVDGREIRTREQTMEKNGNASPEME